jgi:hypothetical protein
LIVEVLRIKLPAAAKRNLYLAKMQVIFPESMRKFRAWVITSKAMRLFVENAHCATNLITVKVLVWNRALSFFD